MSHSAAMFLFRARCTLFHHLIRFSVFAFALVGLVGCECAPGVIPTLEDQCIPRASGGGDGGANPSDVPIQGMLREGDLVGRGPGGPERFPDGTGRDTVFQVVDGQLRPFVQEYLFYSWHPYVGPTSFDVVRREWSDTTFSTFAVGRPMTSRPATWILAPSGVSGAAGYYVVERCSTLRAASPTQLDELYGMRWRVGRSTMHSAADAVLVQNLNPTTWTHYRLGTPLPSGTYPVGQLLTDDAGRLSVVTGPGNRVRALTDAVLVQNGFNRAFAVQPPSSITFTPQEGVPFYLSGYDSALAAPCSE